MDTSGDPLLPDIHGPVPRDRFYLVYGIFYLLGLGSLIPWNFFITASDYFKYKLRNSTSTDFLDPSAQTEMQSMFESYLTVASTTSNLLFNFITALLVKKICIKTRMVSSLIITIIMFILTVVLVKIDTDSWQFNFLIVTLVTAIIINASSSVLGASLFGLVSLFPARYMQAAMTGQAMGGLFAAIANIVSLAISTSVIDSGLVFFLSATGCSILTLIGFCSLYYINYSKYHINEIGSTFNGAIQSEESLHLINEHHGCSYYTHIFKQIWCEGLTVCLVFFVTLSCFPAISSSIISMQKGQDDWTEKYFSAFVCFLLFNAGDWSGRSIAGSVQMPSYTSPKLLLCSAVIRIGFIPLLMFCNAQPRHHMALFFDSDWYPVVFIALLGLTNGYFSTLAMMYGPKRVASGMAETTGAIMSSCLTTGLVSGSMFAILLMRFL